MKLYRTETTLACLSRKIKCSGEHDINKKKCKRQNQEIGFVYFAEILVVSQFEFLDRIGLS